jgi:DNA-binding transcriptional LysR family regulator
MSIIMTLGLLPNFVNTSSLRYFYEVARYGSFQVVEGKVHVAASAIRRQVQLLEDELGTKLFVRDRNGVRLTAAGEALLYRVRRMMWELNTARSEIGVLTGEQTGHVRIGINETAAREFLATFLGEFRVRYPKVTFEVVIASSNQLAEPLLRGEVDIIIGYALERQSGLKQVASFSLQTCITVQRDHPLADRPFVRVSDLIDETFVMPTDDQRLRQVLNSIFSRVAVKPSFSVTTNSFEFIAIMVAKGLGIGCQIRVLPGPDPERPDIVYVPIHDPDIKPSALACYISDTQPINLAVTLCLKQLQGALQDWSADPQLVGDSLEDRVSGANVGDLGVERKLPLSADGNDDEPFRGPQPL